MADSLAPQGPATGENHGVISAAQMKELRTELLSAGVFRHREAASWLKLGLLLAVLGACLTGIVLLPWWTAFFHLPIGAVCATTSAMFGHEGSHRSFSASPTRNHLLNLITFPLLSGLGALYWRHKHDGSHHGHPNVFGDDPDIDMWPMTSSREQYESCGPVRRWFSRNLQGYAFWPLTLFLPVVMRTPSITHLVKVARKNGVSGLWFADAGCLLVHYVSWLVIPSFIWGFWPVFAVYMILWTLVGVMLAMIFAPAHMGMAMPVVVEQNNDWQHQLETTRNLKLPRLVVPFFVGLDYQVEHHLFPKISHQELPRASKIVRAWCARVGVPHQEIAYGASLVDVTRYVHNAWKIPLQTGDELRNGSARDARAA